VPDALHKQIDDAVGTILVGLALAGSPAIRMELLEDESNAGTPYIAHTVEGEAEDVAPLTSASRLIEYPVRLRFVAPVANTGVAEWPGWSLCRQQVIDAFPPGRRPEYPAGVVGCRVFPRDVANGSQRAVGRVVGEIELRFRAVRRIAGV
jgi:hypothetical protein